MSNYLAPSYTSRTRNNPSHYEYSPSSDTTWIWLAILLFAAISLIVVILSGEPVPEASPTAATITSTN